MHQEASFELSKTTIGQYFRFFTVRGNPFDLGGFNSYLHDFFGSKLKTQNLFFYRIDPKWKNLTRYGWFGQLLPICLYLLYNRLIYTFLRYFKFGRFLTLHHWLTIYGVFAWWWNCSNDGLLLTKLPCLVLKLFKISFQTVGLFVTFFYIIYFKDASRVCLNMPQ